MGSLYKFTATIFLLASTLQAAPHDGLREARAYSFIIRDYGLDRAETMSLLQGKVQLSDLRSQWLTSAAHTRRMERYFDEMMGFREQLNVIQPDARLARTAEGIYFAPKKGACEVADAVNAEAWWLPQGSRALFCPNLLFTALTVQVNDQTIRCTSPGRRGFLHPQCGCGPDRISCIAPAEANRLQQEVQGEFSQRALEVYQNNQNWTELLAGPKFFGTRRLYWLYFQSQSLFDPKLYTAESLATLRSIPLDESGTFEFPAGAERAGIATAPGFLVQYNNFRARIAGLTRSFLCQDINPSLNTDGISTFVNPSLKPLDLAHSEKVECSSCHYALDNLGGAVMPWNDRGIYQPKISTAAHAFGQTGQGPEFLMQSLVERGPGFEECMARRAWEDFSGMSWLQTPEPIQAKVRTWVAAGPRTLIHTLLTSVELQNALSEDMNTTQPTDLSAAAWAEMQPIVQNSCGGSSCHSRGSRQPAYAELSQLWITDREKLRDRLQRIDVGQMPPRGRVLGNEDRQILLQRIM